MFVFLVSCGNQPAALPTEMPVSTIAIPSSVPTSTFIPVIVTPSPLPPSPTTTVFTAKKIELKSVLESYFDARYLAFNTFNLDGIEYLMSNEPDVQASLLAELGKLAVEIKHIRLNHLRYMNYKVFLDFHSIAIDLDTQTATISVSDGNDVIHEISAKLNPENPIVSQTAGIEHTIVLRKEQEQWKIVSDNYNDDLWKTLRQSGTSTDEILKNIQGVQLPIAPASLAVTSEPTQLERWKEYENALAMMLLPLSHPEEVLCEWELLGRSNQDLYVWAVCAEVDPAVKISPFFFRTASIPAVLHLGTDGAIQNVEVPEYGSGYLDDVRRIFPLYVQKMVPDMNKMEEHLDLRRTHPDMPPFIILSAHQQQPLSLESWIASNRNKDSDFFYNEIRRLT